MNGVRTAALLVGVFIAGCVAGYVSGYRDGYDTPRIRSPVEEPPIWRTKPRRRF